MDLGIRMHFLPPLHFSAESNRKTKNNLTALMEDQGVIRDHKVIKSVVIYSNRFVPDSNNRVY